MCRIKINPLNTPPPRGMLSKIMNKGRGLIQLYVIPVRRDRWVFGVTASTRQPIDSVSTSQSTHTELPPYLRFRGKVLAVIKQAKDSFDNISHEDGVKGRLKQIVDGLNKRIDPTESALKSLCSSYSARAAPDAHAGVVEEARIEVLYPSLLGHDTVSQTLSQLIKSRTAKHHQLLFGSTALLPVTLAMGILPG